MPVTSIHRARQLRRAFAQYTLNLLKCRRLLSGGAADDCGCADVQEYLDARDDQPAERHFVGDGHDHGFVGPDGLPVLFDPIEDQHSNEFQLTSRWTNTASGPTAGEGRGITLT